MKPSRKRHQERRHFAGGQGSGGPQTGALGVNEWRERERYTALVDFARRTKGAKCSKRLFLLLLEELYIGDEFDEIIGRPEKVPASRYAEAVAFAIVLRHSWRPEDLTAVSNALRSR